MNAENEILKSKLTKPLRFDDHELEAHVLKFVAENPNWGYDRVVGALGN